MVLEDKLYSSTEVAKILGVSRRTLYRYLDSGSLPSMQLPSGRHRFTREQVESFLKTTNPQASVSSTPKTPTPQRSTTPAPKIVAEEEVSRPSVFSRVAKPEVEEETVEEEVLQVEDIEEEDPSASSEPEDEGIEEVEEIEEEDVEEVEEVEEDEEEVVEEDEETDDDVVADLRKTLSSLFDEETEEEVVEEDEEEVVTTTKQQFKYYSSSITDLKKLAKTVKVASENSNVQYAFSGPAGASLYGEVSPFGVLHLYIRENDMLFFEKRFDLSPVESESDANVGIKVVSQLPDNSVVMGFKVADVNVLKKDLRELGNSETADRLEG